MSNLKIIMDKDDLQPLANNLKHFVGMDSSTLLTLDEMNEIIENNIGNLGNGGGIALPSLTNEGKAEDLLSGKQLINSKGMKVTGTLTIPEEKKIQTSKTVNPSTDIITVLPDNGYDGMAEVIVNAISNTGISTADATATASDILNGKTAYVKDVKVIGAMPNNGSISKTIDGLETKTVSIPAGYTSGGTVSVSNKIDNLAATQANLLNNINNSLNDKVVVDTITVQRVDGSFKAGSTWYGEWAGVSLPWKPDILILYLDGYKDQINTNRYGRIESNIIFNLSESNSFHNDFMNYDSNYLRRMVSVGWSEAAGGLAGAILDFDTSNNVAEILCYIMTDSIHSSQVITDDWDVTCYYRAIKYT